LPIEHKKCFQDPVDYAAAELSVIARTFEDTEASLGTGGT